MKLIAYRDTQPRVRAVAGDRVIDVSRDFDSMLALIDGGEDALAVVRDRLRSDQPVAALRDVDLLAPIPIPRRNLFCVGWNYLSHFEEGVGRRGSQETNLPDYPTFVTKPTTAVIGPGAPIPYDPAFSEKLDYEVEIALVIGRGGRSIAQDNALKYVFGYTLANDVSARDIQRRHGSSSSCSWSRTRRPRSPARSSIARSFSRSQPAYRGVGMRRRRPRREDR